MFCSSKHYALSAVRTLVLSGRVLAEVKRACSGLWYISQQGCGFDKAVRPQALNSCSKAGDQSSSALI